MPHHRHMHMGSLTSIAFTAMILLMSPRALLAALVVGNDTLEGSAYTTYQEVGENSFRFVCQSPCPIPLATLQAASDGFRAVKPELLAFTGIDTLPALGPVDIAFESNSICPGIGNAAGYASTYWPYGTGAGQPRRAKVCLFLWERQQNGQIDYFTPAGAGLRSSQTLIVHEYAHTIFFDRYFYSSEDFVRYWSYAISGTVPLPQGMCSENLVTYSAALIYELCQRHGADNADLRHAVLGLEQIRHSGLGYYHGQASAAQLRQILDDRLGVSTAQMFLDLGYPPQQIGGTFDSVEEAPGWYYFDGGLPGGEFTMNGHSIFDRTVKLEQTYCAASLPSLDYNLVFQVVKPEHREFQNVRPDPDFGALINFSYSYAHWTPPPTINPRNLHLYRMTGNCGQANPPMQWEPVPWQWVQFDHDNQRVNFQMWAGGTYAVVQREAIFANGFQ